MKYISYFIFDSKPSKNRHWRDTNFTKRYKFSNQYAADIMNYQSKKLPPMLNKNVLHRKRKIEIL